jgi:hypothetical protein
MKDPICGRLDCLKPISCLPGQEEKKFLILATGQVISLVRHDACARKYDSDNSGLRLVSQEDLKTILSPASAMRNMLAERRRKKSKVAR